MGGNVIIKKSLSCNVCERFLVHPILKIPAFLPS